MWQRDARICTAKAGFFRSGDNSPSSRHVTRRSLPANLIIVSIIPDCMENTIGKYNKKHAICCHTACFFSQ